MIRLRKFSIVMLLVICACGGERASSADCESIFDRLVFLELQEMGFRDPALVSLRQTELKQHHQEQLKACVGRRLPANALRCVQEAESAENVSHECLH